MAMDSSPIPEEDMLKLQQLEAQVRQDPRAISLLIQEYRRLLERLQADEASSLSAALQFDLGNAYHRLSTGDRVTNLQQAMACYREALRVWTADTAPQEYAMTQNRLGVAYRDLPTGNREDNLKQAIACYQEALRFFTLEAAPQGYAAIQTNLGTAYSDLPAGDRAANLRQAIACYRRALRVWTEETAPQGYATVQLNLGTAYGDLPTGDRAVNLRQAIACFQEALRFRTRESAPQDYARTQNNLGIAYKRLPTGDRTANLQQAIACFQEALRFWTQETAPQEYATTQNNLGTAYSDLPTGDREDNLRQAINCYREALRVWTLEAAPQEYAMTQTNLGVAYRDLPAENREDSLQQAIACFQEALRVWTLETAPQEYAIAQNNLGIAYHNLPTGDRADNLQRAIACYREALRFRTPETAPSDYARTQNNLGIDYRDLPTWDRADNLRQAIACFQEALRFHTREAAPSECRMVNRNLANLYFNRGEWQNALHAYRAAIEAGELLYHAGLSAESKTTETAENADIYRHAAFAAVRCGETIEALLMLERGKTQMLAETLRLRLPRPTNVPDQIWKAFERAGSEVRASQFASAAISGVAADPVQNYAVREQTARAASAALQAAIEQVRLYAPEFLRPINLPTIRTLLPDDLTAMIACCVTDQGTIGFVVDRSREHAIQMIEAPTFTRTDLRRLLVEYDAGGRATGGWLVDYGRSIEEDTQAAHDVWRATIKHVLTEVGQRLLTPLLSGLSPDIKRIIFLPSAELYLLPLHAAPLSDNGPALVGERYVVSYVPSLEALTLVRSRAAPRIPPDLYAVINPTDDPKLPFTKIEGRAIATRFAQPHIDEGRQRGTKQRIKDEMPGHSYIHFSGSEPSSEVHI